jgi:hypothetical protein
MTYTCIEYRFLNWTLPNNTVPVFLFYLATNSTGTIIRQYWEYLQFKPTTICIVIMLHWILKPWKDVNLQMTEIDMILCPRWFLSANCVEVGLISLRLGFRRNFLSVLHPNLVSSPIKGILEILNLTTRCIPMDILAWTDCVRSSAGKIS